MKLRLFVPRLSAIALTLGATANFLTQPSLAQNNKFICGMSGGVPATLVRTSRGTKPMIRWVDTAFAQPWTPEKRCEEISARFQRFYKNGTLNFLRAGESNKQNVLCVASYKGGPCLPNGVLVTLKSSTNPKLTLVRLKDFVGGSSGRPIELSGNNSNETISTVNDVAYLDIEKLLAEAETSQAPESCPAGIPLWEC